MELTTIHLVRHGEVENPDGILYGRRPGFHLTALGHAMACGLADYFAERAIRAVITSPLERAIETGQPTADRLGITPETDVRLIEAGNRFEGVQVNRDRKILAHPKYWSWYTNPAKPSWGEPYVEVVKRMSGAIAHGLNVAHGGEAVLVSHQLPIWTMRLFIEGKPFLHDPRKRETSLCSVTSLHFAGNQLVSLEYREPVGYMLSQASDMVPGTSEATEHKGTD